MECMGKVRGGVVVLEDGDKLPEGTVVRVQAVEEPSLPTLAELFKDVAGKAVGLPSDLAANHDHYLHGLPKKQAE